MQCAKFHHHSPSGDTLSDGDVRPRDCTDHTRWYWLETGNLYEPSDVVRVDGVIDSPRGQLVPLIHWPTVDWQPVLGVLVFTLHQIVHHFLYNRVGYQHPVPDRVKQSFVIFDIRALWRSGLSVRVPDVKNYKWRLNPVWHRMHYSCTRMATVGFKGLIKLSHRITWIHHCLRFARCSVHWSWLLWTYTGYFAHNAVW